MQHADPDKTPLVLIPGLLCDDALWRPQVEGLRDVAHCWVADVTPCASLPLAARHVLRHAPFERFALAGLSMGGYLACAVASLAPHRVDRLVLLNTRVLGSDSEASRQRREALIAMARDGDFQHVVDRLLPTLLGPRGAADRQLVAEVEAMSHRLGADVFIRQQRANMARPDLRESLAAIRCPTLIIGGEHDAVAPPSSRQELAAALPHARGVVLEDCGHLCTLEQPQRVTALMRAWLQQEF